VVSSSHFSPPIVAAQSCQLYETDLSRLPSYNVESDPDFDLYEMGRIMNGKCMLEQQRGQGGSLFQYDKYPPVTSTMRPYYNDHQRYPPTRDPYYPRGGGYPDHRPVGGYPDHRPVGSYHDRPVGGYHDRPQDRQDGYYGGSHGGAGSEFNKVNQQHHVTSAGHGANDLQGDRRVIGSSSYPPKDGTGFFSGTYPPLDKTYDDRTRPNADQRPTYDDRTRPNADQRPSYGQQQPDRGYLPERRPQQVYPPPRDSYPPQGDSYPPQKPPGSYSGSILPMPGSNPLRPSEPPVNFMERDTPGTQLYRPEGITNSQPEHANLPHPLTPGGANLDDSRGVTTTAVKQTHSSSKIDFYDETKEGQSILGFN
jgi:hypothetical protein